MGPAVLQEKVVPEHTCSVAFLHSSPSASIPCSLCCCTSYIMSMCNVHPSIMWMKLFIFELQEYQRKYLLSKVVLISVWNKCFCKPLRFWNSGNKWNWSTRLHEAYFSFPFSPPYPQCSNGSSEEQVEENLSFHCIHFQLLLFISNGFGMLCLWTNVSKRSNWNHASPFFFQHSHCSSVFIYYG